MTEPINAKTRKPYNGKNEELLVKMAIFKEYRHNTWATYRQWQDLGFQVKKGEKGTKIMALNISTDKDTGSKIAKGVKFYTVFNIAQVNRIEETTTSETTTESTAQNNGFELKFKGADL